MEMEGAKNIMLVDDMKVTFQIRPQSLNFVGKVNDFHYMCGLKYVPPPFLRRRVINPNTQYKLQTYERHKFQLTSRSLITY